MKSLLVFAVAIAVVFATEEAKTEEKKEEKAEEKKAEEAKPIVIARGLPLTYNTLPLAYSGLNTLPLAYNGLNTLAYNGINTLGYSGLPLAYNTLPLVQPVQTKIVPKEVEIEVKSIQLEAEKTGCMNTFGNYVPCAQKTKREAEPQIFANGLPLAYSGIHGLNTLPLAYNGLNTLAYNGINTLGWNGVPLAYSTLPLVQTVETKTEVKPVAEVKAEEKAVEVKAEVEKTGCMNNNGEYVACAQKTKREAEPQIIASGLPLAYSGIHGLNTLPLAYGGLNTLGWNGLNTLPLTYNTLPAVSVKTVEPKIQEIEVQTPVFKNVVEKVAVAPLCQNQWGLMVPCA
jgi:hypothetical protein